MACHNIAEQRSFTDDLDIIRNRRTIEQPSMFMTVTFRMKWENHGIEKETARKHTQRNATAWHHSKGNKNCAHFTKKYQE